VLDSAFSVFSQGRNFARIVEGLWVTLEISAVSVLLSLILGLIAGLIMTAKETLGATAIRLYFELIRFTPILVLLYLFYYSLSRAWGINLDAKVVAILVFTLWGTAEMADLVRGAVTSISVHQRESGLALGLNESQINHYIVIPLAVRRLIPGVINLTTRMIKTTPYIFFINVPELIKVGQQVVELTGFKNKLASFWVYGFIFFIYFMVCFPISRYSSYLEKKWGG
jgi:polar amino acid transport system permease protein